VDSNNTTPSGLHVEYGAPALGGRSRTPPCNLKRNIVLYAAIIHQECLATRTRCEDFRRIQWHQWIVSHLPQTSPHANYSPCELLTMQTTHHISAQVGTPHLQDVGEGSQSQRRADRSEEERSGTIGVGGSQTTPNLPREVVSSLHGK
jgi:hypothetical protein